MNKVVNKIKRDIRHRYYKKQIEKSGWIFHHTSKQIVVTKNELRNQLKQEMWAECNLIKCIVLGRENPDYKKYLYLVCLKFEVISGFIYVEGGKKSKKLLKKEYKDLLFDSFLEDTADTKSMLEDDLKIKADEYLVQNIYRIYSVVAEVCSHMMAHCGDTAYINEFAHYIDYIIATEGRINPEYEKSIFPTNMPACYPETEFKRNLKNTILELNQEVNMMGNLRGLIKTRKFVVFDLETTGLDCNRDYIIEIGAVKIEKGKITERFSTFANSLQLQSIPQEIEELTGISYEQVKDAPLIDVVLKQFYEFAKGCILVAHNLPFDFAFLRNWGFWCGVDFNEFDKDALDTVVLAKEILNDKVKNYKLSTLAKYFGIEFTHHRALNDAEATAKILIKLVTN